MEKTFEICEFPLQICTSGAPSASQSPSSLSTPSLAAISTAQLTPRGLSWSFFGFTTSKWFRHPNCGYSDIKTLASMLHGALPSVAKKTYNDQHNEPIFYLPMIRCLDDHQLQLLSDASYFGDWSHGWSRLQQTKRCAFLGEGETRSMLNVIGSES